MQYVVVDMDDHINTVVERDKLSIGDDRGDLDERVVAEIEACHLAVHPDEPLRRAVGHRVSVAARTTVVGATLGRGPWPWPGTC